MMIYTRSGKEIQIPVSGNFSGIRVQSVEMTHRDLKHICDQDPSVQMEILRNLRDSMVRNDS